MKASTWRCPPQGQGRLLAKPLVVFIHEGFEPQQASLSAMDAPERSVQLKKKPGAKKPPPPPGLGIKTGR